MEAEKAEEEGEGEVRAPNLSKHDAPTNSSPCFPGNRLLGARIAALGRNVRGNNWSVCCCCWFFGGFLFFFLGWRGPLDE